MQSLRGVLQVDASFSLSLVSCVDVSEPEQVDAHMMCFLLYALCSKIVVQLWYRTIMTTCDLQLWLWHNSEARLEWIRI